MNYNDLSFNLGKYDFTRAEDGVAMDDRHIQIIHAIGKTIKPNSILEIGCHHGRSTTALVELLIGGYSNELHLCDLSFTPELLRLIQAPHVSSNTILYQRDSSNLPGALFSTIDMVIIDGDHGEQAIDDCAKACSRGVGCIILHDSHSISPYAKGSVTARKMLIQDERYVFEDNKTREGERTDRGLTIAFSRGDYCKKFLALEPLLYTDDKWWETRSD